MDAGQEMLEAVEIGLAFDGAESGLAAGAAVVAALGDSGGARSGVRDTEKMEAGLFEEALVFAARNEKIVTDGTANGEFFVGDDAGDDESVAEDEAAAGFENAEEFAEDGEAIGDVAHGVIGIDSVEGGIGEREMRGGVVKEESDAELHRFRLRESGGALDAFGIYVQGGDAAAGGFGEVEGAASGTAADFERGGLFCEFEKAGDFGEFFGRGPTGLAEIGAVGFETDFAVGGMLEVGVGGGVGVNFFGEIGRASCRERVCVPV